LIGKQRERCRNDDEDGRYERGEGGELYSHFEALVHLDSLLEACRSDGRDLLNRLVGGGEQDRLRHREV
jgi:hypothetical protein